MPRYYVVARVGESYVTLSGEIEADTPGLAEDQVQRFVAAARAEPHAPINTVVNPLDTDHHQLERS